MAETIFRFDIEIIGRSGDGTMEKIGVLPPHLGSCSSTQPTMQSNIVRACSRVTVEFCAQLCRIKMLESSRWVPIVFELTSSCLIGKIQVAKSKIKKRKTILNRFLIFEIKLWLCVCFQCSLCKLRNNTNTWNKYAVINGNCYKGICRARNFLIRFLPINIVFPIFSRHSLQKKRYIYHSSHSTHISWKECP